MNRTLEIRYGTCQVCGERHPLSLDDTMAAHLNKNRKYCTGDQLPAKEKRIKQGSFLNG